MLKIGDKIPNINVTTHKGESINLSDLKGKKIVLFFYPRANTPGCTAQSCNLNDNYSRLTSQGYEVVGVSPDTVEKQNKFADKFGECKVCYPTQKKYESGSNVVYDATNSFS